MSSSPQYLFLVASARQTGHPGNTEWLARRAAESLAAGAVQTWLQLEQMTLPPFIDMRHTTGSYPMPEGDLKRLLDATMQASDIVLVSPVYWYSIPAALKTYIDHWSAWMRVPGLPFKERMGGKTLRLVTTSGDRPKAQPMIDSVKLCAQFLDMRWGGELWGKGGAPGAVKDDAQALAAAGRFLRDA
ncbi:MAG: NAD(P)H-dependent oxidoreductase [Ramlibacter sp.]|nr:NAD(P)H-dependent oxidoreductase [Ramlibacter sp.]